MITTTLNVPAVDRTVTSKDNQPANGIKLPKLTEEQMTAIAKAQDALVDKLGAIVTDDVNEIIVTIENARKDAAAGPFKLLKWFMENVDEETLAMFPTPGSDVGDNPDKYSEPYFRDGKRKWKATSFYLKFFLQRFPAGKAIAQSLAHIEIAKDENANPNAIPENIRNMNPVQLDALRQDLLQQQNKGVKAIRDAIALDKQLKAVNDLPEVGVEPIIDPDTGEVARIAKPIKVWNLKAPDNQWNLYSINGFMAFDPAKALELGGTFDALKLTAKRARQEDQDNGESNDKPQPVNTNSTMVARINDIAEYIANKLMADRKREAYALFLKNEVAGPDGDELIYNLNEIKMFVDSVLNIPQVQSRLEIVQRKKDQEAS
jgi:hypothetical protein